MRLPVARPPSRFVAAARVVCALLRATPAITILCAYPLYAQTSPSIEHGAADSTLPWYKYIAINGLISGSYTYNFNRPTSRTNELRVFDVDANSLELDLVSLSVRHDAAIGESGFRVDLDAGPHIPSIEHSSGLEMRDLDLRQGYLTYVARIGAGLKLDLGKFVTPACIELIEGADGVSDNASHSYLFGYAMPYTHTGLRLTYPFVENFSLSGLLVNGWDNSIDMNEGKTGGLQVVWSPGRASFSVTGLFGPEKPFNSTDMRALVDFVGTLKLNSSLRIGVNADFGSEQNDVLNGTLSQPEYVAATWRGIAGYVHVDLSEQFGLSLRAEVFDDPDGVRTGVAQSLREFTLTPQWRPSSHFAIRGDVRYDNSTMPVFSKRNAAVLPLFGPTVIDMPSYSMPTASLNAIVSF